MRFIISAVSILLTVASAKGQTAKSASSIVDVIQNVQISSDVSEVPNKWGTPSTPIRSTDHESLERFKQMTQPKVPFYMEPSFIQNGTDPQMYKFGGDSSGGGNSVILEGRRHRLLLDFYATHHAERFEQVQGSEAVVSTQKNPYRVNLPLFIPSEQRAYALVERSLEKWAPAFPELVATFKQISQEMYFFLDDRDVNQERRYWLSVAPEIESRLEIKTVASYRRSLRAAIISRHVWNSLDLYSQAGLLLHETLRHVQIVEETSGTSKSLSDRALQELVTILMLDEPSTDSYKAVLQKISQSTFLSARYFYFNQRAKEIRLRTFCENQSLLAQHIQIPGWSNTCIRDGQTEIEFYHEQATLFTRGMSQVLESLSFEERAVVQRFNNYFRATYSGFVALESKARVPTTVFVSIEELK